MSERERETYAYADRQLSPRTALQNMLRKGKGIATVATESIRNWQPKRAAIPQQQQQQQGENNNNNREKR